MSTEVEARMVWPQPKKCQQPPEDGGNEHQILPRASGGSVILRTPWFGPSETDFGLLAPRTVEDKYFSTSLW